MTTHQVVNPLVAEHSTVFHRFSRQLVATRDKMRREEAVQDFWNRPPVSDAAACRILKYVGRKLKESAGRIPDEVMFQKALIVLTVYFGSRGPSAIELLKRNAADTVSMLLLKDPALPPKILPPESVANDAAGERLTPSDWGELLMECSPLITGREHTDSPEVQTASEYLSYPLTLDDPDSCVDQPIDPAELLHRLHGAIATATVGAYGTHKATIGLAGILISICLFIGVLALTGTDSGSVSAAVLLAPFGLTSACWLSSIHVRYRLRFKFSRRSFATAETVVDAGAVCITVTSVLLGFISVGSAGTIVTVLAIVLLALTCALYLSARHAVAVARIRFE